MDKKKLTIGIFVTLSLILSGAYIIIDKENTYYCESRNLVGSCEKLSKGIGTWCYFNNSNNYKICSEGWQKIENFIESPKIPEAKYIYIYGNLELYSCELVNGTLNSYSLCISQTGKEDYAGELI